MSCNARIAFATRPAVVAVHDDSEVTGNLRSWISEACKVIPLGVSDRHQIGFFLHPEQTSTSGDIVISQLLDDIVTAPLLVLGDFLLLQQLFEQPSPSRLALRTDTRADSASPRACLIYPLRVSSVSTGMGIRITSPAVAGIQAQIRFHNGPLNIRRNRLSNATTLRVRASSILMFAN